MPGEALPQKPPSERLDNAYRRNDLVVAHVDFTTGYGAGIVGPFEHILHRLRPSCAKEGDVFEKRGRLVPIHQARVSQQKSKPKNLQYLASGSGKAPVSGSFECTCFIAANENCERVSDIIFQECCSPRIVISR